MDKQATFNVLIRLFSNYLEAYKFARLQVDTAQSNVDEFAKILKSKDGFHSHDKECHQNNKECTDKEFCREVGKTREREYSDTLQQRKKVMEEHYKVLECIHHITVFFINEHPTLELPFEYPFGLRFMHYIVEDSRKILTKKHD